MIKYIFYNKKMVGTFTESGEIVFNQFNIENSGMPPRWMSDVKRHLLNSLPEGERLESLILVASTKENKPSFKTGLIPYVDDLPGHFSIGNSPTYPEELTKHYVRLQEDLPSYINVNSSLPIALFHSSSPTRKSIKPSFSGYQDKFVAKLTVENGQLLLSQPTSKERGNVIVKPANPQFPHISENEFACMKLAEMCGFEVPRVFLFQQADAPTEQERQRKHYAIERFDYVFDEAGIPQRLTISEAASLMGLSSENKYDTTTEELFKTIEEGLAPEDMVDFSRKFFFGILICNGDMHTKNFSFTFDESTNKYKPTPIYDQLCTSYWKGFADLALPIGQKENFKNKLVINFMKNYMSVEDMYNLATQVRENLDSALSLAFDSSNPQSKTAHNRMSNLIMLRTSLVLKELVIEQEKIYNSEIIEPDDDESPCPKL